MLLARGAPTPGERADPAVQSLVERNGAVVTAVGSAAAALTAFERSRPDVLLGDLGMPGESGYDLMRRIAALDAAFLAPPSPRSVTPPTSRARSTPASRCS